MIALLATPLRAQRRTLRLAIACAVLAALAGVALLAVSGWFLAGAGVAGLAGIAAVQAFNYLLPSAAIRAAAIVRTAARHGERLLGHRAALFALADVRPALFGHVARAALHGREPGRSGLIANRLGRDVDTLEDAVIRRVGLAGAGTAAGAGLIATLALGARAVPVMGLALIAMRLAGRTMAARLLPRAGEAAAAAHAALQADYAEMATPAADIAVYGLAEAITAALDRRAADHDAALIAIARGEGRISAVQAAIAGLALATLALLSPVDVPRLALGLLAASAALEIWAGLVTTDFARDRVAQAEARLVDMAIEPPETPIRPIATAPTITIAGRTFAPGSRLAVAGASGAGKTRLIETLIGLRRDAPQALLVDGRDPRALGLAALRPAFALCAQDAPLIAGSVADNLLLARPGIDEAAMWRALHGACLDDVVRALPDGLGQWLGGDGARLSGGQRRRLALARALLTEQAWLVLDEPSEGLDAACEARLIERLGAWLDATGRGLVLVSHRPAMAALAHETILLSCPAALLSSPG